MADTVIITAVEKASAPSLLPLLAWFSPSFPVGAFAFSHGLEAAVADGALASATAVRDWIEKLLTAGSGWNDLVLLSVALRTPAEDDVEDATLCELAEALAGSATRRAETLALGAAFGRAAHPWAGETRERPYPLAVAAAARAAGLPAEPVLLAFAHGFAAALLSACVRLVPLGQSDAVALQYALEPTIAKAAHLAKGASLDALGSASILSEIAAMRHETLRTRLFRS